MSTAAGLGALGEGIVRGMKLGSDMNDAEQRRGLMGLQMKREQAAIDKEAQFNDLSKQLAQEYSDLRDGKGAYAPAEGQTYNPADPRVGDIHYSRIEPLLKQQAALSGKNPELVSKELRDLRRERYAENVFRAAQLFDAGDVEGGTAVLQPLYNRVFTDGTDVKGVAYNKANDSLSMTLLRDGKESVVDMPRAKLVDMLTYGALNTGDAVKLRMQRAEKAEDRTFEAGQRDQDRGLKRDLTDIEQKGAMARTVKSGEYSIQAAGASASVRQNSSDAARYEKNRDDFVNALPKAFGYDSNDKFNQQDKPAKDGKPAVEGALTKFNRDAAEATSIWDATAESGVNLTANQVRQVLEATRAGAVKIKDRKGGYAVVQAGAVTAVVPEQYLKAK